MCVLLVVDVLGAWHETVPRRRATPWLRNALASDGDDPARARTPPDKNQSRTRTPLNRGCRGRGNPADVPALQARGTRTQRPVDCRGLCAALTDCMMASLQVG